MALPFVLVVHIWRLFLERQLGHTTAAPSTWKLIDFIGFPKVQQLLVILGGVRKSPQIDDVVTLAQTVIQLRDPAGRIHNPDDRAANGWHMTEDQLAVVQQADTVSGAGKIGGEFAGLRQGWDLKNPAT